MDLFRSSMSPNAGEAVKAVLTPDENGRVYCGQGPVVEQFERAFYKATNLLGLYPPLGVNSCTAAIDLALHLIGVGPGDEVACTPMTCSASNGPVVTRGAKIVWIDVDPITGLMSAESLARMITRNVKAVIAVDWAGRHCDYAALKKAVGWDIPIIEDAAHCLHVPQFPESADYICWSFGPIKHLSCGGYGGALMPPEDQYRRAELLRWHGLDRHSKADFRCINGHTKIRMANGRAVPIAKLVADKNPGPVLVYEEGQLVPRKVVGWHTNPLAGRRYLRIGLAALEGREAAIVTEDHLVLTRAGWKRADELREDDEVATAYPKPSALQRQLLIGGLLGDAGINGLRAGQRRNVIVETHTARDRSYAEAKVAAFSGLGMQLVQREPDDKHPNGSVQFWSKSLPTLAELGRAFYPNGHKHVPRELIEAEGLSDAALAIWYMDDGSTTIHNGRDGLNPYCQIASNGFTEDDVRWLVEYLAGVGLACSAKPSVGSTGWRIFFTKDGSRALIDRIARFVPPDMRYKVGHLPDLEPFDADQWGSGESEVSWDRVVVTDLQRTSHRRTRSDSTTYCLTVEGGASNFVAGPIVVHNCEQDIEEVGYRYHLTDDQAAVGLANLELAQYSVTKARLNAAWYRLRLTHVPGIRMPDYDETCNYWLHGLIVHEDRDGFAARMAEQGIPTSRTHARNDHHSAYAAATARQDGDLPGVTFFDSHQINIPGGHWITQPQLEEVARAVEASVTARV